VSVRTQRDGGWTAPVSLPERLEDLHGPAGGAVRLPLRVHSSGAGPEQMFDLGDDAQRAELYEIVLENGAVDDICRYVHAGELRQLWDRMWLSPHVRRAWEAAGLLPARAARSQ
jgi:hypothetical protein